MLFLARISSLTSLIHINMFQIYMMPHKCKKRHPKITECTVGIGNTEEKVHFSQNHIFESKMTTISLIVHLQYKYSVSKNILVLIFIQIMHDNEP